jgi:hypothetical protein
MANELEELAKRLKALERELHSFKRAVTSTPIGNPAKMQEMEKRLTGVEQTLAGVLSRLEAWVGLGRSVLAKAHRPEVKGPKVR